MIAAVALGWVAPNDAFEATAPDAPDATLRLAWVVEARTQRRARAKGSAR